VRVYADAVHRRGRGSANLARVGGNAATDALVRSYRVAKRLRRRLFERMGSDRYSTPALYGIDVKLRDYLPGRGFFVEAGANDGYRQSNTYWLERFGGWSGLLVEPVPAFARLCAKERPGSRVVNCALGPPDGPGSLTIHVGGLMSKTEATPGWDAPDPEFGEPYTKTSYVTVPARTLSSLLDEMSAPPIDFLSLDVEGYEPQVLAGIEARHLPRFMLIECNTNIEPAGYRPIAELSPHDVLFERIGGASGTAPQ
jgi:FkbM family methyltransferase